MLIQKSHDTKNAHEWLRDALWEAFTHDSHMESLWVQKYKEDSDEMWEVSLENHTAGRLILTPLELEGVKKRWEETIESEKWEEFESIVDAVEELIHVRWKDKYTYAVETYRYEDEYDLAGVRRSDFSPISC